jgi:hypothetical protein
LCAGSAQAPGAGPRRVTHLPLARVLVHPGDRVAAGARVGTLGTDRAHGGLHLGVRRAGDPFAYVDPLPFLARARPPMTAPPPVAPPERRVPAPLRAPPSSPRAAPRPSSPLAAPRPFAAPGRVRVSAPGRPAPWPAWVGLALALSGAFGGGVRWRVRRARAGMLAREGVR